MVSVQWRERIAPSDRHMGETVADNAAVASVINTESSKCEQVMHLRRSLVFLQS